MRQSVACILYYGEHDRKKKQQLWTLALDPRESEQERERSPRNGLQDHYRLLKGHVPKNKVSVATLRRGKQ